MKITKEQAEFLEEFLNETGFELWNAGASYRMSCVWNGFTVCDYALNFVKDYQTAQGAINFMIKKDEE